VSTRISAAVRDGAPFAIDLMPDRSVEDIAARLSQRPKKRTLMKHLAALGLDPVKRALLQEFGRPLPEGPDLARLIKALPVRHGAPTDGRGDLHRRGRDPRGGG
jgi:predicted flavoprotein YhiN